MQTLGNLIYIKKIQKRRVKSDTEGTKTQDHDTVTSHELESVEHVSARGRNVLSKGYLAEEMLE